MTTVINYRRPLRERKKQATRARIVETAIRLFAKRGFDSPTIDEIAAKAEVGKGTIYNYFRTKEEIVVAYMVGIEERLQVKTLQLARRRGSPASILTDFAWTHLKLKAPHRDFVRIVMTQIALSPPEFRKHLLELQRISDPPLRGMFSELQSRGAIRRDVAVAEMVFVFKILQVGFTTVWLSDTAPYHGTRHAIENALRLFVAGISTDLPKEARSREKAKTKS